MISPFTIKLCSGSCLFACVYSGLLECSPQIGIICVSEFIFTYCLCKTIHGYVFPPPPEDTVSIALKIGRKTFLFFTYVCPINTMSVDINWIVLFLRNDVLWCVTHSCWNSAWSGLYFLKRATSLYCPSYTLFLQCDMPFFILSWRWWSFSLGGLQKGLEQSG